MRKHRNKNDTETPSAASAPDATSPATVVVDPPAVPPATDATDAPTPEDSAADGADAAREIEPLRERLLRLQADFDNFRKRMARERIETVQNANERLLFELLPVIDHMDLALKAGDDTGANPFSEGFRMVRDQMLGVLERFNVRVIDTQDAGFDPNLHEAVAHVPSDAVAENDVLEILRKGYMLGERLLRPAQVVVSSGPPAGPAKHPDPEE